MLPKHQIITALILLGLSLFAAHSKGGEFRVGDPSQWKNLTVYPVYGKTESGQSTLDSSDLVTLDEALSSKTVVVYETGDVNELAIENLSQSKTVFIQAGDIVKGGRQDRVLSTDLLLKPQSGRVAIDAFCVEQGRWSQREGEASQEFNSSKYRLSSKDLKVAAIADKEQGKVWQEVAKNQSKLSEKVATSVNDSRSVTSLQLSLESDALNKNIEDYLETLEALPINHYNAIGYVAAINGRVNTADVFASPQLFQKQWPKLAHALAAEALAEHTVDNPLHPLNVEDVEQIFQPEAEVVLAEKSKSKNASPVYETTSDNLYLFESRLNHSKDSWVHKGFIKK